LAKLKIELDKFGFNDYQAFLNSRLWFEFKDHFKKTQDCSYCRRCGSTNKVSFHHLSYKRLLDPRNIAILCDECHKWQHDKSPSIQDGIDDYVRLACQGKEKRK